jgi:hypothetical protein
MSYSYLINIDTDGQMTNDDIMNYIMGKINDDEMADNIDKIQCISNSERNDLCRLNLKKLGKIFKASENSTDICSLCDECYDKNQLCFVFDGCEHKYHKKCVFKSLKTNTKSVCHECQGDYVPDILSFVRF